MSHRIVRRPRRNSHRLGRLGLLSLIVALGSAIVLAQSGASTVTATKAKTPFRALLVLPLTGIAAATAPLQVAAWDASAAELNVHGGILGHRIVITTINDQANPSIGVSLLQNALSAGPTPNIVLPGGSGSSALAYVPILAQDNILAMGGLQEAPLDNPKLYPLFFSTAAPQASVAAGIAHGILKAGYTKVAVLTSADGFGSSQAAAVIPALQAAGVTVTGTASFPDSQIDVTPELQQLQATNPQALFFDTYGTPAGYVLNGIAKLGWKIPVFGGNGASSSGLAALVPASELTGVKLFVFPSGKWVPYSKRSKGFEAFLQWLQKFSSINAPLAVASTQYDILQLVNAAAVQAKSIGAHKIAHALELLKQPKNPPWVTFHTFNYSPTEHFANPAATNFAFVQAGPLVQGMLGK